jgi:N-acetylmuramic acid 6-phosphate etherase
MNTAMSNARDKAKEFLEREKAFRLGQLLTESSHPKTWRLSQTMETDIAAGVRLLQSVDEDIPAALGRIFAQDSFHQLVEACGAAMRAGRHIFFTGCGATGRLSILLEAAWRRFWRERGLPYQERCAPEEQGQDGLGTQGRDALATLGRARMEDRCISIMAGRDFALIKSVEGFEDFPDFGRHQLKEAGVQRDDVVVAITEGGETSFVIGTAWQGLEADAHVFFVYNNPSDLLRQHVQRSREVLDEPRIHKLDLATGPMAITGSTRMQATTTELFVVGAALEMALAHMVGWGTPNAMHGVWEPCAVPTISRYEQLFAQLLAQLSSPEAVAAIARMVELEEQVYRRHGLVTYIADALLLDILTDTTERAPTFMLPPFRKEGDTIAPVSWSFVKSPRHPTRQAWADMLQREPRGLTWGPETYRHLNAPLPLQANPPKLDNEEIYRFRIGNEPDPSRTNASDSLLVLVGDVSNHPSSIIHHQYHRTAALTFGPATEPLDVDEHIHVPCEVPASPLRLWEHLAIKLILNTLSTATMVRLGRVIGNAMVWVSPSNKKLIDRGCRLIAQQTGCTYERACEVLHEAMEEIGQRAQTGEEVPSPVALAIERIASSNKEKPQ